MPNFSLCCLPFLDYFVNAHQRSKFEKRNESFWKKGLKQQPARGVVALIGRSFCRGAQHSAYYSVMCVLLLSLCKVQAFSKETCTRYELQIS
jgi:hypothetical protein